MAKDTSKKPTSKDVLMRHGANLQQAKTKSFEGQGLYSTAYVISKKMELKDNFNSLMEETLEKDPEPSKEEYNKLHSEFEQLQSSYITGSRKEQEGIKKYLKKRAEGLSKEIDDKEEIATLALDEVDYDIQNPLFDTIVQIFSGKADKIVDKDNPNEISWSLKNEDGKEEIWDMNLLKKEVQKITIDRDAEKTLNTLLDTVLDPKSEHYQSKEQIYNDIHNKVVNAKNVNLFSLATHELIPGVSFKDSFTEALTNISYDTLLLSPEENEKIKSLDPDTDGDPNFISPDDAEEIVSALIDGQDDLLKEYLTGFYTNVFENNRSDSSKDENKKNESIIEETNQNIIKEQDNTGSLFSTKEFY